MIKAKLYNDKNNELIFVEQIKDERLKEFTRVFRCYGSDASGRNYGNNLLWEQASKKAYDMDNDTRFYGITSQIEID